MADDLIYNSSKRLPIVFCLDVSPSMGWQEGNNSSSIEVLNTSVAAFIKELKTHPKARTAAEVAFVTFSTEIVNIIDFESIGTIEAPKFSTVQKGGTQMAQAILKSVEMLENRRRVLENAEIPYYAPFLVLLTDGNPDDNDDKALQNKAIEVVKQHCDSHVGAAEIVVPFIIGVGDRVDKTTLTSYSAGFVDGFFHIKGNADKAKGFNKVFKLIGNSTIKSIHLNKMGKSEDGTSKEVISYIKKSMKELLLDLGSE